MRLAVETAKRILTKEKIDKQLAGRTSSTPFMSVKDRFSKRVTFNAVDDLEQKIDRVTVMMGKLVKGNLNHLSHKYINAIEVEIRIEAITKVGLGITMSIEVIPHTMRTLGVEQEIALIIEETTGITCKVIKDIETIIIIEETVIEVKIMTGTGVGH